MKYEIQGTPLPVVTCTLEPDEKLVTARGVMCWMSDHMTMNTSMGGASRAIGRMFSGESIHINTFSPKDAPGMIAFSSSFPGRILPVTIHPDKSMIVQKGGFLACQESVSLSVYFQKRLSVGAFSGEGFIMQKLCGQGLAFVEIDGHVIEYKLGEGESMLLNTGYLAMMEDTVEMRIKTVKGIKNKLFGGKGFFLTRVTGPGRIWIQSMPVSAVAASMKPYIGGTRVT